MWFKTALAYLKRSLKQRPGGVEVKAATAVTAVRWVAGAGRRGWGKGVWFLLTVSLRSGGGRRFPATA
jgi:hypothetical protein